MLEVVPENTNRIRVGRVNSGREVIVRSLSRLVFAADNGRQRKQLKT
jgi:hypothetical protein